MLFIDMDILSHSSIGSLVVAMDSNVGDNSSDFSSEASNYASEFEDVVEHEATNGVADVEDEIIPPCKGYSWEQWVDLDVVLLNSCAVPVADDVCSTSRKHGKKESQSFVYCGSFDHPDLQSLNDCKFFFFGLPTEFLGIWGLLIYRWKGLENTFPTVYYMPPKF
jgi:hypothetical protein